MCRLFFLLAFTIFWVGSFGTSRNKSSKNAKESAGRQSNCKTVPLVGCGRDGKDGKDGQNGKDGRDGLNGKDGRDGLKGRDGRDGREGPSGAKGEKGSHGDKGPPGEKGVPGTCVFKSSSSSKSICCSADCSTGFHFFEKVQDLPTRGAVDVEHFTIDGSLFLAFANYNGDIKGLETSSMIYKMDESTGRFSLHQSLKTMGGHSMEYFAIHGKHFLAVANNYQTKSVIYQWNGKQFNVFQKLSTIGAIYFTHFMIQDEMYLALSNNYDGITYSQKSFIYKWSSGKFNKFQEIATEGARSCEAFVINSDVFIAFANSYNSQQKNYVQSTVFKWSGRLFVKLQSLQTYRAYDVKYFNINGHAFLAFANSYTGSKHNTDSFIYKWNGNKFVLFQSIGTRGASSWHPFVISGQTYLGMANQLDDSQKRNIKSVVYQASGAHFIKYQEILTDGARDMTSFKYKSHTYLAVANNSNGQKQNINSALYKWV